MSGTHDDGITSILGLKPGDIVEYLVDHYTVESRVQFASASLSWTEWVLHPGASGERVSLAWLGERLYSGEACRVDGEPGAPAVTANGQEFELRSSGRVDARWAFDGGETRFDRPNYWHYETPLGETVEIIHGHLGQWALHLEPTDPGLFEVFAV